MKSILKTLTVASTLALPALAGCGGERQEANAPMTTTTPTTTTTGTAEPANQPAGSTSEQPKVIDRPVPPTSTPAPKPKEEEAPKKGG